MKCLHLDKAIPWTASTSERSKTFFIIWDNDKKIVVLWGCAADAQPKKIEIIADYVTLYKSMSSINRRYTYNV